MLLPAYSTRRGAPAAGTAATVPAQGNAPADTTVQDVESEFRLAEQHYQNAITKLEQAARLDQATAGEPATGDQATIDPATAAMLQKNLHVIDAGNRRKPGRASDRATECRRRATASSTR